MIKTYKRTLKNGLTILMVPDETKNMTQAKLMVNYGAAIRKIRTNNKTYQIPFGLAHLLEHNIVENSIYDNAIAYFNQNYVASNAYTTDFRTMFYIDVVCDFEKHLEELITMVNKPLFTNKLNEIKKPIYEEIKRKQDIHNYNYIKEIDKAVYINNYINVLGSIENVKKITNKELNLIHKIFYTQKNQTLMLSGNFNHKEIVKKTEQIYKKLKIKNKNYKILDQKEKIEVVCKEKKIIEPNYNEEVTLAFKVPTNNFTKEEKNKLTYYLAYFLKYNFDDNSKNFKEITNKKYSLTSIRSGIDRIFKNMAVMIIELSTKNHEEFKKMVLETLEKRELDKKYFELEKRMTLIDYITQINNYHFVFSNFVNNYIDFNYCKVDTIEFIENLNYEECMELLKKLDFSNYATIYQVKE